MSVEAENMSARREMPTWVRRNEQEPKQLLLLKSCRLARESTPVNASRS